MQADELPQEGEVAWVVDFALRQILNSRWLLADQLTVLTLPLLDHLPKLQHQALLLRNSRIQNRD